MAGGLRTIRRRCSACEGLAGPKGALYLRARHACKSCYKKAGSKQNRVRKRVLYRLTERFGGSTAVPQGMVVCKRVTYPRQCQMSDHWEFVDPDDAKAVIRTAVGYLLRD